MNRVIYARLTSLTLEEIPVERIEGRVTGGSINIDGTSAVRRTCSITMVTPNIDFQEYNWSLNNKFIVEIGVSEDGSEIKWYPQGTYVITSFSSSLSTNAYTINIQGKDKMCQLNGENGGSITSQTDFGQEERVDVKGNRTLVKRLLKDIIRDMVHFYGHEPYHNIVIEDLDDEALELQTYRGDEPLYLLRLADGNNINNYTQASFDRKCYIDKNIETSLSELASYDNFSIEGSFSNGTQLKLSDDTKATTYVARKVEFGQTIGYVATELIYMGDLQAQAGEAVTSILDKIKNQLGDFEYFYDVDGRFIFRRKPSHINVNFTPLKADGGVEYVDPYADECQYYFTNHETFTSFNNTPNLANLKNDFCIWGTRKSSTGKELASQLRYAIDKKPQKYKSITVLDDDVAILNEKYGLSLKGQTSEEFLATDVDWRELIYRMALDYFKYGQLDDFAQRVAAANPEMPTGRTGYEQYYTDMQGFWRQLYSPEPVYVRAYGVTEKDYQNYLIKTENGYDQAIYYQENIAYFKESTDYYREGEYKNWHKNVIEAPDLLPFWIDFLDTEGELSQYSVKTIGIRNKVSNDKDVKAIYYRDPPSINWGGTSTDKTESHLQMGKSYEKLFALSTQGKSAIDALNTLLYNHACVIESVSVTSIPIYDLEPNKKVHIQDSVSNINGKYLVSRITLPLVYNGTMNITATKVVDRIL